MSEDIPLSTDPPLPTSSIPCFQVMAHDVHSKAGVSSAGSGYSATFCPPLPRTELCKPVMCVPNDTCPKTRPVSSSEVLLLLCAMWPTQTCPPQQPAPLLCPLSLPQIWGLRCPPAQLAIAHCNSAHLNCSEGTGVPPTPCYCRPA